MSAKEQITIDSSLDSSVHVHKFSGILNADTADRISEALNKSYQLAAKEILIDLSAVTFINGEAMKHLVAALKKCHQEGWKLRLKVLEDSGPEKTLALVGFLELFQQFGSEVEQLPR